MDSGSSNVQPADTVAPLELSLRVSGQPGEPAGETKSQRTLLGCLLLRRKTFRELGIRMRGGHSGGIMGLWLAEAGARLE